MKLFVSIILLVALAALACAGEKDGIAGGHDPLGSLVIIGGSERFRDRELWEAIVDLAGGDGAKIAILPTAGGRQVGRICEQVVQAFKRAGAEAGVVPVVWNETDRAVYEAVVDPELVDMIRASSGVYFVGGSQGRIVDALRDGNGQETPMLAAIRDLYSSGGVIAGTSAGAAIMGHVMYRDAPAPLQILRNGVRLGRELDRGLGFLDPDWFVEQHCLVRGRFARALVAMRSQNIPYGIGVDENTALVVRRGRQATVIGYKGVLIMDASAAASDDDLDEFNVRNVVLSYLDRGDAIDLHTLKVTPAAEKVDETVLDPTAPDFSPYYDHRMCYTDVLGNATVAELMGKLIDNTEPEAIGLAFNAADAQDQPAEGFEFRFYRGRDSRGWYTESFGGEDYTVLNIHLDIRPIAIAGPLYTRRGVQEASREAGDAEGRSDPAGSRAEEPDAAAEQ